MQIIDNDLLSIQEARILAETAKQAQGLMAEFSQEKLDRIVMAMADAVDAQAQSLAILSHDETEYGRPADKVAKNRFVCRYARRHLADLRCVGVIREDRNARMMEVGVPLGVIVSLCPATSPVSTTLYSAMIAVKSGNAVIFCPHPRARKTMGRVLDLIIEAATEQGLPRGALSYLHTVAKGGTQALMEHRDVSLILNAGVPSLKDAASRSGKPFIYGGTGNGPCFIERTADIGQAVRDIIASKTFDNGVVAAAEQAVVVDRCISGAVKEAFTAAGGYFMSDEESLRLAKLFFCPSGGVNPAMVGISARELCRRAAINAPGAVLVLIAPRRFVDAGDPYLKEKLCPVITYFEEDDWQEACEKCIELLLSGRSGHTLVIHSTDEHVIRQFALKKPVGRVLVNTPGALGGMGASTNMFPSMILGSGSQGLGITSDNVSPYNLIYVRKVGFGVHKADAMTSTLDPPSPECRPCDPDSEPQVNPETLKELYSLLKGAVQGKGTSNHTCERKV